MEPSTSGTSSTLIFITRRELVNILRNSGHTEIEQQFVSLRDEIARRTGYLGDNLNDLNHRLSYFKHEYKIRWTKAKRIDERFFTGNSIWLDSSVSFPRYVSPGNQRGRPTTAFEDSGERAKRKKTEILRGSTSTAELSYATKMSLRASGNIDASTVVHEITATTPKRASKYRQAYRNIAAIQSRLMSPEEALALLVEAKLSRHQYDVIRRSDPERFPSYKCVQQAKKLCYPQRNCIKISATSAEVQLQALLDHTVQRLIMAQEAVLNSLELDELKNMCLYTKWGFDGSSGHSSYKQAFHGAEASDSSVFITSIVPIRLVCTSNSKIIWQNPRPSSPRYCRPLQIEFVKESSQVSVTQKNKVDNEIQNLQNTTATLNGKIITVNHNLIFAMIDGKVCNALTETKSTQQCYICGATSKQFNNIDEMINRNIKIENLQFGLSVLHGWIRFFECLLHLAYKLPIKKWQARGKDKEIVAETKLKIQNMFRERTGLIVDKPKPGFGNSNDGNTARRFFANPELSAEITNVDVNLIKKMHIILMVVASGHEVNIDKFREFAQNTARYFVEKYPWYFMPPTVHKFLIHGPEIISSVLLPIGQLTEEAQEARNKDFKMYREHYSRKCSREKSNEDVLNLFLLSSDPLITSKRHLRKKNIKKMPQEALELLEIPSDPHVEESIIDTSETDEFSSESEAEFI